MKQNFKKNIFFVLSLSVFQVVVTTPHVWAVENADTTTTTSSTSAAGSAAREARMGNRQAAMQENKDVRQEKMQENKDARQAVMQERQDNRQEASCDRIISIGKNSFQNFSNKKQVFGERFGDVMTNFEDRRDTADATLNGIREKQDEKRNEMYMRLEEVANKDVAKLAALEDFKKTVEKAVTNRRDVIDNATGDFRKSVDEVVASKKADVTTAIDVFQSSVDTAFKKAEADCADKADPKTVRDTLTTSMKDAREKLQESRRSFEKTSESIPVLAEAKKTAINEAMQDFTATIEKARTDLKAAFGK